ncbi:extracellular solute-binding protein [Candidatus Amarolinea dominans]|uniref:ABC transporter substrate-binding protein n=1 Tax=Candidatus Amarolinea dominans TaxID=3140696 RepID=UPI0031367D45|nr:extracellular solute-binding protein [Anaerolineae bacterium]MBK9094177.1 extracellular solute-binding protein [Anaerolineae bacterium]
MKKHATPSRALLSLTALLVIALLLAACGGSTPTPAPTAAPTPTTAPPPTAAPEVKPTEAPKVDLSSLVFFSTQFAPVEEQEKFRAILKEGGFDFTSSEEGPLLDMVTAGAQTGKGTVDLVGALHGSFPPLQKVNAMANLADLAEDLATSRSFAPAFLETGLLASEDYLYYVPWMQATYVMAAHKDAIKYLPSGADINALTWQQFAGWCKAIYDGAGKPLCGLPHAGLFQRFLEGYMWPSFTGGMVSNFQSNEAASMLTWMRDELWPYVNPQSITYSFMQEPLLAGEVWVAFDHTARLIKAFNEKPNDFVAFPAPAGPAGRGFMPVVVGLGIPKTAPNPAAAMKAIEYLTSPAVQGRILKDLGFFPVVGGVSTTDLPAGTAIELAAVSAQANSADALPALLPVGLGARGGEINQIFRNAFDRVVLNGEQIANVLPEEAANLQKLMNETGAACWAPDPASDGPCQVKAPASALVAEPVKVTFFSTQFVPVEEQEKFRAILKKAGFDVTGSEEGPLLDLVNAEAQAGKGTIDVVGALHGSFPPLQKTNAMVNMIDLAEDLSTSRSFAPAFMETGLLGSEDYLYYVPWMQATYIMAAHKDAMKYLPAGADVNALTWQQLGAWCKAIFDGEGKALCGLPHAGLFHRFLEGYMWPSFTGGMVSNFQSQAAEEMLTWLHDDLWPYVHAESINYSFMQEPLLAGDVWVAFDHTARLLNAFNEKPDDFVAFPAPSGPAGRGFMPVVVGLGIPKTAPNPDNAKALIDYLTRPGVQEQILRELGFFPVVGGVSTTKLPKGVAIELGAVTAQANSADALPALLPVGLGARGGEINQIFRNAFDRVVLNGEAAGKVLAEEAAGLQALMNETGAACWAPDPPSTGPCQVKAR